ncbi:MAG: 4-hydroxy-tetrahydrodipicolinate reductase [Candidatus Sumerlaeaceae bacterium]|nr:4-hydroxy-tetrahydrodipicolinate reductase [Candidatus Sumerlaeaceae bacterium]
MSDEVIRIVVSGALGRMGRAILDASADFPNIEIVGALETLEKLGGEKTIHVGNREIPAAAHIKDLQIPAGTVVVDFSNPIQTRELAHQCAPLGAKLVVGTTGLSDSDQALLYELSQTTAVLVSSNMSVGVQVMVSLLEQIARQLPDFDIEIVELHHRRKKDSPSGTALLLGEAAARGRQLKLKDVARHGRHGLVGERPPHEIGFHAVRGGDIVGEHIVIVAGEGEHLELRHSAHSRMTFARGALRAAGFLAEKPRGFFTMRDVIQLGAS